MRTDESNRPATVALVTSVFAFLGIALFWLGVPLVAAGASIALARRGQERAERWVGGYARTQRWRSPSPSSLSW